MHWLFFALISVVTGAVGNVIRRKFLGRESSDPVVVAVLVQLVSALFVAIYLFNKGTFRIPPLEGHVLNYLILTVFWTISSYYVYMAYKHIEAGEATLLNSFSSVMAIIGGVFILHEVFVTKQLIGALCILTAVVIIAFENIKHFEINKGFFYMIIAAGFAGMAIVNDAFMLKEADAMSYLFLAYILPGMLLLLIQFKRVAFTLHHHKSNFWVSLIVQSLLSCIAAGTYYTALEFGAPASQLSPIGQSGIILTVLFGALFLGERKHLMKKSFCTVLVFIGCYYYVKIVKITYAKYLDCLYTYGSTYSLVLARHLDLLLSPIH